MNIEQNYNKKWKEILTRIAEESGVRFIGVEVGLEVGI